MFENPPVPESKLYPTDSKEMVGKEEWVAEKAMEVRSNPKLMFAALEWDGEQTGSEEVYHMLAEWMKSYQFFDLHKRSETSAHLELAMHEIAVSYAEYVLLPAHIEKMKNGNFEG